MGSPDAKDLGGDDDMDCNSDGITNVPCAKLVPINRTGPVTAADNDADISDVKLSEDQENNDDDQSNSQTDKKRSNDEEKENLVMKTDDKPQLNRNHLQSTDQSHETKSFQQTDYGSSVKTEQMLNDVYAKADEEKKKPELYNFLSDLLCFGPGIMLKLFTVLVTNEIISNTIAGTNCEIITTPENQVIYPGMKVSLKCQSDSERVFWFQNTETIWNGIGLSKTARATAAGCLSIDSTDLWIDACPEAAGTYSCVELDTANAAFANVTFIDDDPICFRNETNEWIYVTCAVRYRGPVPLTVMWMQDSGKIIDATDTTACTDNNMTILTSILRISHGDSWISNYTCFIEFNQSGWPDFPDNKMSVKKILVARNVPAWRYNYTFPALRNSAARGSNWKWPNSVNIGISFIMLGLILLTAFLLIGINLCCDSHCRKCDGIMKIGWQKKKTSTIFVV